MASETFSWSALPPSPNKFYDGFSTCTVIPHDGKKPFDVSLEDLTFLKELDGGEHTRCPSEEKDNDKIKRLKEKDMSFYFEGLYHVSPWVPAADYELR